MCSEASKSVTKQMMLPLPLPLLLWCAIRTAALYALLIYIPFQISGGARSRGGVTWCRQDSVHLPWSADVLRKEVAAVVAATAFGASVVMTVMTMVAVMVRRRCSTLVGAGCVPLFFPILCYGRVVLLVVVMAMMTREPAKTMAVPTVGACSCSLIHCSSCLFHI